MEDLYGERGNLMPRDIVSKCIYAAPSQVYLDIAFLGEKLIKDRLFEVTEVCQKYAGIDATKESIPVYPSVHFFMGGLRVDNNHKTTIDHLYAVGECASKYHGANRLGGNSLLAAVLANESYLIASQTADKKAPVIGEYKTHFGAGCSKALSCQSVCPMKIETLTSIMRMNRI